MPTNIKVPRSAFPPTPCLGSHVLASDCRPPGTIISRRANTSVGFMVISAVISRTPHTSAPRTLWSAWGYLRLGCPKGAEWGIPAARGPRGMKGEGVSGVNWVWLCRRRILLKTGMTSNPLAGGVPTRRRANPSWTNQPRPLLSWIPVALWLRSDLTANPGQDWPLFTWILSLLQ